MTFARSLLKVFIFASLYALDTNATTIGDTCAYTFNIPATDCSVAPDIMEHLDLLESTVLSLQATLTNQQSHIHLLTDRIYAMEESDDENDVISGVGSTYVRWGRTECPNTAQLVYKGYIGKSHYIHYGGGVDYQCLHMNPEWPVGATAGYQSQAYIYGVEYEIHSSPLWPSDMQDADAPCAVCSVNGRGRQLMIPARLSCPDNWTLEYSGLLATQHHTHKGATYICIDSEMEAVNGGDGSQNGGLLYVVEAVCGSLKCPPYENGYEIACVVCTY